MGGSEKNRGTVITSLQLAFRNFTPFTIHSLRNSAGSEKHARHIISIRLGETVLQHPPGQAASKACWLMSFIRKMPKFLRVFGQDVPYAIMKVYVL